MAQHFVRFRAQLKLCPAIGRTLSGRSIPGSMDQRTRGTGGSEVSLQVLGPEVIGLDPTKRMSATGH